jgi:hypothetical protein
MRKNLYMIKVQYKHTKNSGDATRKERKLKTEGMENCLSLPHIEAL